MTQLVAFDTDKIKSYVFATSKLKEIRGASALLNKLNREDMVTLTGGKPIYANGGGGLFLLEDGSGIDKIREVRAQYRKNTLSASVTGVCLDLPKDFTVTTPAQDVLKKLNYLMRLQKDQNASVISNTVHSYFHTCDSCGGAYARQISYGDLICESCHIKRKVSDQVDLWDLFVARFLEYGVDLRKFKPHDEFSELGELSRPKGYMGLLYADGNNMGKVIEDKVDTLEKMKTFSEAVDDAIYAAVAEAIKEGDLLQSVGNQYLPFGILLLGGDDLVMVTTAQKVLVTAVKIARHFPKAVKEKFGEPLYLSIGVVIAHVNFPFGSLREVAEDLLKFAKKTSARHRLDGKEGYESLINFQVINASNTLQFSKTYDKLYTNKLETEERKANLYRSLRPYTPEGLERLIETVQKTLKKAPTSKLNQLYQAVHLDRNSAMLEGLSAVIRLRDQSLSRKLRYIPTDFVPGDNLFPWSKKDGVLYTPFLDLVEVFNFIEK